MTRIRILVWLLFVTLTAAVTPHVLAQEAGRTPVVKVACLSALSYGDLELLRADLLLIAKREAANELFGELIAASTTVDDLVVTSDQIRLQTLGLVRLQGSATYANGPNLAEVCATITAYATEQDYAQFRPVSISKRQCLTDASLTVGEVRIKATEATRLQALIDYDPRLAAYPAAQILPLLRQVAYPESDFLPGTDTYCVTVVGAVTPIEVVGFLALDGDIATSTVTRAATTPTNTATPTPRAVGTLSPANATATAAAATVIAYQSRTPTPTSTFTATPNHTATAIAATAQAIGSAEALAAATLAAQAAAIATEEASSSIAATLEAAVMATAVAAGHTVVDLWTNPVDEAVYVYVPAGPFTMGSGDAGGAEPPRQVDVDAFWIMRTEVTNAQYAKCVAAGACTAPNNIEWQDAARASHPVAQVDWEQANAYAEWVGGRLPTEEEWEKAARGTDARVYPWGDSAPTCALVNFSSCGGAINQVGSLPAGASPYGALDMAGNVWEWTATLWEGDPTRRVVRGGSWANSEVEVRAAYRKWGNDDGGWGDNRGFRVVSPPNSQ